MPDYSTLPEPQGDWLRFVDSLRVLLVHQLDDRPLDQFLPLRDAVLALVSSQEFLDGLKSRMDAHYIVKRPENAE